MTPQHSRLYLILKGVPARTIAQALNELTPSMNWNGCTKTFILEQVTTHDAVARSRVTGRYGTLDAWALAVRAEHDVSKLAKKHASRVRAAHASGACGQDCPICAALPASTARQS